MLKEAAESKKIYLNTPVKLRRIMCQSLTSSGYPVEPNDPPDKWKHRICWLEMLNNTAKAFSFIHIHFY